MPDTAHDTSFSAGPVAGPASGLTAGATALPAPPKPSASAPLSLEAVELALAFDDTTLGRAGFVATVQTAARDLDAEYLFELPASGLALDCQRIAMLRMKAQGRDDIYLLVKLAEDGRSISVAEPDEETKGLTDFARAFVNVLTRL